jgi:hypothetical protein
VWAETRRLVTMGMLFIKSEDSSLCCLRLLTHLTKTEELWWHHRIPSYVVESCVVLVIECAAKISDGEVATFGRSFPKVLVSKFINPLHLNAIMTPKYRCPIIRVARDDVNYVDCNLRGED